MKRIENKSGNMLQLEQEHGVPIEELLRIMYVDRNMAVHHMTKELRVSYMTVHKWLRLAGIQSRGFAMEENVK